MNETKYNHVFAIDAKNTRVPTRRYEANILRVLLLIIGIVFPSISWGVVFFDTSPLKIEEHGIKITLDESNRLEGHPYHIIIDAPKNSSKYGELSGIGISYKIQGDGIPSLITTLKEYPNEKDSSLVRSSVYLSTEVLESIEINISYTVREGDKIRMCPNVIRIQQLGELIQKARNEKIEKTQQSKAANFN
ncbi:MAG: hypothetical protein OQJ89_13895 [Kangiellaceae bacterium]|nr:hypothetical protein [Kangiellaceae bacterium]MCW9018058.1 hypothetical protein [Kangiellaceae bacterium]